MDSSPLSQALLKTPVGHFDDFTSAKCAQDMLQGLVYLHGNQIVHGNLEGSNVFMTSTGVCKLSDYGLDIHRAPLQRGLAGFPSRANWTAPEVLDTDLPSYTDKSDIWSLGCTVYEIFTGQAPYAGLKGFQGSLTTYMRKCNSQINFLVMYRVLSDVVPPISKGCSPLLVNFLQNIFAKGPADRPSAGDLLQHEWITQAHGWKVGPTSNLLHDRHFLKRIAVERQKLAVFVYFSVSGCSSS